MRLVRCLTLLLSGAALAGFEAGWTGILPPILASPVLAGLGVALAGLAALTCGALYADRRAGRISDPGRALAVLRTAAGISALVAFYLLAAIEQPYAALSGGFRGAAAASGLGLALLFAVIFVPCFLAGAALALSLGSAGSAAPRPGIAAGLGTVAVGLASGLAISGWLLAPSVGSPGAMMFGAGASIAAGALALLQGRRAAASAGSGAPNAPEADPRPDGPGVSPACPPGRAAVLTLLAVLAASEAACALTWTRVSQQAAGPGPYTGAAAATIWLAFAGLGALLTARVERRIAGARYWVGLGAVAAGAVWLVPLHFANDLPFIFLRASGSSLALALAVFAIPGLVWGAALALALGALEIRSANAPGRAGAALAAIALGAVVALVVGLAIPSRLVTLRVAAVLAPWPAIALGTYLAARGPLRALSAAVTGVVTAAALAASLAAPPWNQGILTSGVYTYAQDVGDVEKLRARLEGADVPYRVGDRGRIISVLRSPDGLLLRENGNTVATTGADLPAQVLAGHVPLLLSESRRSVLVLGLGTGITVGSAGAHPVERIDCVEPFAGVAAAARYFSPYNGQALADPRVTVTLGDPANYLLLSDDVYDVIVSRQALAADVVRLARTRLATSGVFCQLVDLSEVSEDGAKYLAKETAVYFPYVALWWAGGSRLLITGSQAELKVESETLRDRLAEPKVVRDLRRLETVNYVGLLSFYLMGRESLVGWATYAPAYSRYKDFLAYHGPTRGRTADGPRIMADLDGRHDNPATVLADLDPEDLDYTIVDSHLFRATEARSSYFKSLAAARDGKFREAAAHIESARGNCPENGLFTVEASDFYVSASRVLAQDGRSVEAVDAARRALVLRPGSARAFYNLAALEIRRDPATAAALLKQATELDPAYLPAYLMQAEAEIAAGLLGPASETISKALSLAPLDLRAHNLRGMSSLRAGHAAEARADFERVADAEPRNTAILSAIGYTWLMEDNLEKAQKYYQKALSISPDDVEALNNLATVLAEREQYPRAADLWEKALRLDPGNPDLKANLEEVRQRMPGP